MKSFTACVLLSLSTIAYSQADCLPNAITCKVEILKNGGTSTSSTLASSNTAAVVGAELGSAAVLAYFIEIRPLLQRIHNEKINAIEGQFQGEYRALDSLITTPAPETPAHPTADLSVSGHKLGESWQEFVTRSPRLAKNISACEKRSPLKQTKKHRVYDPCSDVRYMANAGSGTIVIPCRDSEQAKNIMCRDFNGEITFVDSKLAALKIILPNVSLADAAAKFGPPSGTDKEQSAAVWHNPLYAVAADRMVNGIGLSWQSASQYSATTLAQRNESEIDAANKVDASNLEARTF